MAVGDRQPLPQLLREELHHGLAQGLRDGCDAQLEPRLPQGELIAQLDRRLAAHADAIQIGAVEAAEVDQTPAVRVMA